MLNPDIAYLLGMIAGKGEIKRGDIYTQIIISLPHKNLEIESKNIQQSVKASLLDITQRLRPLVGADLLVETANPQVTILHFAKPNGDFLIRTINTLYRGKITWRQFRIPKEIFETPDIDIKKEFLRGLADVTGHIRSSNSAWSKEYENRVYIEIMDNWDMAVGVARLLKDLDVPVQDIRWAHPNFVDPRAIKYKKGSRNTYKEHQIKIWAEEFEKIGFSIDHKNSLLKNFADKNRRNWPRKVSIEKSHHKFYWKTRNRENPKKRHPDENNPSIHPKIRGRHFDSWKEIASELGYHE